MNSKQAREILLGVEECKFSVFGQPYILHYNNRKECMYK